VYRVLAPYGDVCFSTRCAVVPAAGVDASCEQPSDLRGVYTMRAGEMLGGDVRDPNGFDQRQAMLIS